MANAPKRPGKAVAVGRPVESLIHVIRGQKVMLDSDLATLYAVTTGNLNLAVRRNASRFPADFMFKLSKAEADALLLQTARAKTGRGGRQTPPFVFTELGVAMLSSVLNSERAVQMNMLIMRAFVRLREMITHNKDLAVRIEKLERGHDRTGSIIEELAEDIGRLAREVQDMKALPPVPKRRIGFIHHED
jgi:ORF6N domain-containing protein